MRNFILRTLLQIGLHLDDEIKENVMHEACRKLRINEECTKSNSGKYEAKLKLV
jgi:hypothetical protein